MNTMNDQERWERAVAIGVRIRELLAEMERLPKVPIVAFLDAEMRRKYRRFAARLRAGKVEPRYGNLFTKEQLADLCEQAAARDEFLEKAIEELHRLADDLRALLDEHEVELAKVTTAELLKVKDAARWYGPDSQAAHRYRDAQKIRRQGQRRRNRPQKTEPSQLITLPGFDYELHWRHWLTAAEVLPRGTPAGEPVLRFPSDDTHEERIVLSIGIGPAAWIGSFSRGLTDYTTVQLMPDTEHLLVIAAGAGYIIDAASHALVAEVGRDIATVICEDSDTLLLLDPEGRVEASYTS
jgi:hypothetical protein